MVEEQFSELIARVPHPNGKLYALIVGGWAAMSAMTLLVGIGVGISTGELSPLGLLVMAAVTTFLGSVTFGYLRRQAFYFYAEGYQLIGPLGRTRTVRWQDVREIRIPMIVQTTLTKPRTVCEIRHLHGRKVRFTEIYGREIVAPLAVELHAQATAANS